MLKHEATPAVATLKLESVIIIDVPGLILAGSTNSSSGDEKILVHEAHKFPTGMLESGIDMENQSKRKNGAADVH